MPDQTIKTPQSKELPLEVRALIDLSIPKIYANGFSIGLTNADAQLVLKLFGKPIAVLSFSYTLAKTLSEKLSKLVTDWETKTGSTLQSTEAIDRAFGQQPQKETPK